MFRTLYAMLNYKANSEIIKISSQFIYKIINYIPYIYIRIKIK